MKFVYTSWYIVLALLVVAIAVIVYFIVRMDKQDKVLIDEFTKGNAEDPNTSTEATPKTADNVSVEKVKE